MHCTSVEFESVCMIIINSEGYVMYAANRGYQSKSVLETCIAGHFGRAEWIRKTRLNCA